MKLCLVWLTRIISSVTGLIAACRHSNTILQNNGHVVKPVTNGMSNGHVMVKTHQNGHAFKTSNGLLNGVYSNGNGVHL